MASLRRTAVHLVWVLGTLPLGLEAAAAEPQTYKTTPDILYREGEALTDYMRQRCRLDVYARVAHAEFATVVWFHGAVCVPGSVLSPRS